MAKNFIQKAIKHPGALRRQLGVKGNKPIPAATLSRAANSSNETLARRARFAQTLKKLRNK